ncbi:MAG: low molecular weight protein-tyrosine-phosphatase [Thermaurantimonas sp.]|uniref:low molecular weight protein-tyrosine-phosphatase n=1 Tax=Thermaurantimonas sp. TaxID=2681568 RepID=UPI003919DC15
MKILMVCLGNICRSPLAEGILKSKLKALGVEDVVVDSAGISSYHIGEKPDPRTMKNARKHGIDLSDQRARQFRPEDFEHFDLIYAADRSIYDALYSMAQTPEHLRKVKMMTEEAFPGQMLEVPDPYYGTENDFESVFKLVDIACDAIIQKYFVKKQSAQNG